MEIIEKHDKVIRKKKRKLVLILLRGILDVVRVVVLRLRLLRRLVGVRRRSSVEISVDLRREFKFCVSLGAAQIPNSVSCSSNGHPLKNNGKHQVNEEQSNVILVVNRSLLCISINQSIDDNGNHRQSNSRSSNSMNSLHCDWNVWVLSNLDDNVDVDTQRNNESNGSIDGLERSKQYLRDTVKSKRDVNQSLSDLLHGSLANQINKNVQSLEASIPSSENSHTHISKEVSSNPFISILGELCPHDLLTSQGTDDEPFTTSSLKAVKQGDQEE
jgi:hypothetical protein